MRRPGRADDVGSLVPEYDALSADFRHRGKIIEEQIALMRALCTGDWVEHRGRYHNVAGATLGITPAQRPIPLWLGGGSDAVLERIGRIGDGWIATARADDLEDRVANIRRSATLAGRDPASVGIQGRAFLGNKSPEDLRAEVSRWQGVDATHIDIRDEGFAPGVHLDRAARFCREMDLDLGR